MKTLTRRRIVVDDSALAARIGMRLREARTRAGLTQQKLAEGRYTKAYVSALEKGHAKPSMAALTFFSDRLGLPPSHFLGDRESRWHRIDADLLLASGRWQEAADAYESVLETQTDRGLRAESLRGLAEALCRLDRGSDAIGPATEAVEAFARLGRDRDAALATYWLANAQHLAENTTEARALLSGLLSQLRARTDADPDLRLRSLMALSTLDASEEQHRSALGYLEEARAMASDLDDWRRALFLSLLAYSYTETGDMEAAIRTGVESLGLFRAAESQREVAKLENNLALAYLRVGNAGRAWEFAGQARSRYSATGDRHALAHVAETEAQIALSDRDVSRALSLADEAIGHAEASDNHRARVSAMLTRARAHVVAGDLDIAIDAYDRTAAVVREHGPRLRLREALGEWADVLASLGRHQEAYALTREALQASMPDQTARPAAAGQRVLSDLPVSLTRS
ncbi:MAG: helix-turn-helix domain-containing protein [Chloroflexi bacterium]|nr:helix-turn-helix domain-containing protein [Chloroflexota bacterium]